MRAGIAGWAAYVPYWRIGREEYRKAWGTAAGGLVEKTVADVDEDALTMAVEAGRRVLGDIDPGRVSVLACASTTFPYAEKASAPAIAAALGVPCDGAVIEAAGSAACGAQVLAAALESVAGDRMGLLVVADNPAARPGDEMEHALGAGSAALLLTGGEAAVAVGGWTVRVRETLGSRFRPAGEPFLRDAGLKTLSFDAAAAVVVPAVKELWERLGTGPSAYRHAVFTQPGARQVEDLGRWLGLGREQLAAGLVFGRTGDTGAASAFLGLCAVLDTAGAGDRILFVAYGSGAVAVAVDLTVRGRGRSGPPLADQLARGGRIDYVRYLKMRGHIV